MILEPIILKSKWVNACMHTSINQSFLKSYNLNSDLRCEFTSTSNLTGYAVLIFSPWTYAIMNCEQSISQQCQCNAKVNDGRIKCHWSAIIRQEPYVNQSAMSVADKMSLHRAYVIFRSLGLRHMVIVDEANRAVGVVTRKDLMAYCIEERLQRHSQQQQHVTTASAPI